MVAETNKGKFSDNPHILVAERDMGLRHRLVELLTEMGFINVESTANGTKAWSLLKRQRPALVMAGWNLQEINGLTFLKIVRADSDFVTMPFLLITEVVTKSQVVDAGEAGVSEILCRPINLERLRGKVNALLFPEDGGRYEAERVYQRGLKLMSEERWQEAVAVFQHILTLYESPEVYYNLGYINTVLERYEEAIAYFSRATEIDHSFARAHQRLGECFLAMGRQKQAREHLNRAAEIHLDRDQHATSRGEILEEVMRVNPVTINIFNTLGIIYRRQGRLEEAVEQYRKALRVNPQDENIHYNLGRSLVEMDDLPGALVSLDRALEINPGLKEAANLRQLVRQKGQGAAKRPE